MAGIELVAAQEWLYSVLSTDVTISAQIGNRIYSEEAEQGASFPYIIYKFAGGYDVRGVASNRIFTHATFLVKAVDKATSFSAIKTLVTRVDTVLQGSHFATVTDGLVYHGTRIQPVAITSVDNGISYRHLGGLYRLIVQ